MYHMIKFIGLSANHALLLDLVTFFKLFGNHTLIPEVYYGNTVMFHCDGVID